MNWLAHLALGGPDPRHRLGQLAGDFVRGQDLGALPEPILAGVLEHRAVDAHIDADPAFRELQELVPRPVRRFRAVIADVLLDHALASRWDCYMEVPFEDFIDRIEADLRTHADLLPDRLEAVSTWLPGRLRSYRQIEGIREALTQMSQRLRRPAELQLGATVLETRPEDVIGAFEAIWPGVQERVLRHRAGTTPE